jgi:hypothetical protein
LISLKHARTEAISLSSVTGCRDRGVPNETPGKPRSIQVNE